MTETIREALVLPMMLLSVALLGGLQLAGRVRLEPPPLSALMLAMVLLAALAAARVHALERLLHGGRTILENVTGGIILASLFAATAQIFNLLLPETGLLHGLFVVFLLVQMLSLIAARPTRPACLRSLLVLFGATFALKFVILESLFAPGGGVLKRVLAALLQGVSLGGIEYEPKGPATGYVAFFTLLIYFVALVMLPAPAPSHALERTEAMSHG